MTAGIGQWVERRIAAITAAILLVASLIAFAGAGTVFHRSRSVASADVIPGPEPGGVPVPAVATAPSGAPLRVRIPAIGVLSSLVPLGLNPDRTLEVPSFEEAGWYAGGIRPGDPGPAVIAAHVDSKTGPAVFYRLRELQPGDLVHVDYRDGTVTFAVRESESFAKSRFPTAQVYGRTDGPELRLITCDGTFDRKVRSYRSNLVVWANLADPA